MKIGLKKVNWIKKIVIGLLSFICLLMLSVFIFSTFYSDNISKLIVNQINKNLNASISVSNTRFWLIKYFPNAALTFYNVKIVSFDQTNTSDNTILNTKELSLKFDLIELIKGNYIIKGIVIKDGTFNCTIDKSGKANYEIWHIDNGTTENAVLQIHKIMVYNLNTSYFDIRNGLDLKANITRLKVSGQIQTNNYDFNLITTLNNISYSKYNEQYKIDDDIKINSSISVKNNVVLISDCKLDIFRQKVLLNGEVCIDKPYKYNFSVKSDKIDLLYLCDRFEITLHKDLKIQKAICNIKSNVSGRVSNEVALIKSVFEIENSTIEYKENKIGLLKTKFEVVINPYNDWYVIKSYNVSGGFNNSKFTVSGEYKKEINTDIDLQGFIDLNYIDINKVLDNKNAKFTSGSVKIKFDLKNKEAISCLDSAGINQFYYNAKIKADSINLTYNDKYKIVGLNGDFVLNNKLLTINTLDVYINNNDLNISGRITNNFFDKPASDLALNSELIIKSKGLDIESLYFQNDTSSSNFNQQIAINLSVDELKYKSFIAGKLKTTLKVTPCRIEANEIQFNTLNGFIKDGNLNFFIGKDSSLLETTFEAKNIDLKMLFSSFNNFGLVDITSNNIKGKISSNSSFSCSFDNSNNLVPNSLKSLSEIEIKDGAISKIDVLNKLFNYLKINNINELSFGTIRNTIIIENGNVIIAPMRVATNAINFEVSGNHYFSNDYEYHFKFNLSDVIRKRKKDEPIDDILFNTEKDTSRRIDVFVILKGKGKDFKFSYDNKKAMNSFVTKLRNEKLVLKDLIKNELGINKDTVKTKRQTKLMINNPLQEEEKNPKNIKKSEKKKKQQIEWKDE